MVWPGTWMLEVGLSATCTTTSWPEEMPPSMPPALLLRKPVRRQLVAMLAAALLDAHATPGADLDGLDRVDAHHRVRDVGIEPVEHRLAQAGRHAGRDDGDARADRVARARESST